MASQTQSRKNSVSSFVQNSHRTTDGILMAKKTRLSVNMKHFILSNYFQFSLLLDRNERPGQIIFRIALFYLLSARFFSFAPIFKTTNMILQRLF